MAAEGISRWLRKKRRNEVVLAIVYSLFAFAAGAVIFFVTFSLVYFVLTVLTGRVITGTDSSARLSLVLTFALAVLGTLDNFRASRDEIIPTGRWFFREVFYIGPRLLLSAVQSSLRMARLAGLDVPTCSGVLFYLASKRSSVSKDELLRAFSGLVWKQVVSQLVLIRGVLFFRTDFSRVTLVESLRQELRQVSGIKEAASASAPRTKEPLRTEKEPEEAVKPNQLSYYEILGVSQSATLEELKAAYRNRMKECHPDRFSGMGVETQHLAEEWSKAINLAYHSLLDEREGRPVRMRYQRARPR